MAKQQGNAPPLDDWQALSRQYWDAWTDATRKAFGSTAAAGSAPGAVPWHEGLEQWSRLFDGGTVQDTQNETVERLLAGARSYFALLQSMAEKGAHGDAEPQAWTEALRNAFNFPGADAALFDNPLARAMGELGGRGAKGFEPMMDALQPALGEARAWLDLPAFGYAREHQQRQQAMAKAMLDYQHQTNRYNALIARASRQAFEIFEDKLAERSEPGRQIGSVRGLYDLWVDAAEEAYAEIALSAEFREVYGALVNAQMRVRQHLQQQVEESSNALGMPTRTEIDSIGQRVHALHREAKNRAEHHDSLQHEIEALRAQIDALKVAQTKATAARKSASKAAPARKPAAKSAPARKPAAKAASRRKPASKPASKTRTR